jgi:hypothetical protein
MAQLRRIDDFGEGSPYACRAWLQVLKGERAERQAYFDDIDAVGSSYGFFLPRVQPRQFLAIVKNRDYDGRLYLIGRNGTVIESLGGFYILTSDGRYLISEYLSDISGIAVVDVNREKVLFSVQETPHQWYRTGKSYFFTESEWLPLNKGRPTEKPDKAYFIDVQNRRIRTRRSDPAIIRNAKKLSATFDPRQYADCETPANLGLQGSRNGGAALAVAAP